MPEKELTLVDRCILITLMIKATPLPQTYFTNVAGIGLKAEHRRRLESGELIEVTKDPRITLALTDAGWERAAAELRAEPPKGAGTPGGTLYVLLEFVGRLIDHTGLSVDDLFRLQIRGAGLAPAPDAQPGAAAQPGAGSQPSPPAEPPAGGQVDPATLVRQAYRGLATAPGDYIMLADLRSALDRLSRAEVDAALVRLNRDRDVHLVPESNQKVLRPEERAAAVRIGNQDKHLIAISA
ncbi:hypothetical protein [Plantactinospora sp. KBS50]|uniref:hypothetical protein n=1 Tax=Plantactinospora sp. KBS50 TaxID=2024580 RepID=UPI000BAA9ABC|nr:hypothetical protein [Plantactinospora sp. KBS50]ASW56193.1 hypothetical protein CIK06_21585 [Plantactinospora sp. KBS50]